jgi:hypothetical protein
MGFMVRYFRWRLPEIMADRISFMRRWPLSSIKADALYTRENTREENNLIPSNFCVAVLCPTVPLTAVQQFKGELCLWANAGYLRTCLRCRWLGFWEVHQARSLTAAGRIIHLRPLHSATSSVQLHMSFLFSSFSEVKLMIDYLLIYQTWTFCQL